MSDLSDDEYGLEGARLGQALFEEAFEHCPVGMAVTRPRPDGSSVVLRCNEAYATMLGYSVAELVGLDSTDLMHPDDNGVRERLLVELRAGRKPTGEFRVRHRDGYYIWILLAPAIVATEQSGTLFVMHAVDISDRKRFESRLRHLADHDPLTGLLSRRRFEQELSREVARARRSRGQSCLLLLDLDGFKFVNDSLGHSAGDRLLRSLGDALGGCLREADVMARIGGDEFAVVLPETDVSGGREVASKLLAAVRQHGRIVEDGRHADVTASVGMTVIAGASATDAEGLLVEADIAMYQAKDGGKNQLAVYTPSERRREALTRRADWVGRLREAMREGRLLALAQPVLPISPAADQREHYELLVRLRDDGGGLIKPGTFMPHAERHGMIVDIDHWIMRWAVAQLHAADRVGRELSLAINFSAVTLQDPQTSETLMRLLEQTPIGAGELIIEVTETAAITDISRAGEFARQLQALGCKLALDDFGTGFTSFGYLRTLVFDILKIDGSFIEDIGGSPTDQLLVRALVDIAHGLGASVVAERISDQRSVELLAGLGVDYGQGNFLGRAAPLPGATADAPAYAPRGA